MPVVNGRQQCSVFTSLWPRHRLTNTLRFGLITTSFPRSGDSSTQIVVGSCSSVTMETRAIVLVVRKRRSEEHTSELQSRPHLVCRLLLAKKKKIQRIL